MKTTPSNPPDSPSLAALTRLLRTAAKPPTPQDLERGLRELRVTEQANSSSGQRARGWLLTATALVCLVLGAGAGWLFSSGSGAVRQPVALDRVDGGKLLDGGYLAESGRQGIKLLFNEGTQFELSPGTRGRLRAVDENGATFAIDRGTASFRIVPSAGHQWRVEAGPFVVTVKGTDFTVDWDPSSERLEVGLRRGRVSIRGPALSEELVLRPGQRLSVNLPKAETLIREERAAPIGDIAASSTPSSSAAAMPVPSPVAASSQAGSRGRPEALGSTVASGGRGERQWAQALANGQWDRILAEVEREGVDSALQVASSADLLALADAARYRRRSDLARAALIAQLRRFPSSPRSTDAMFLLGRTEELGGGGKLQAIHWYDEYLSRAPGSTYAAEALGRKMILLNELGRREGASHIAADYLGRFPTGSYAGAARALARSP